ncbi:MAG: cation transporter, partial [Clostridia bacterium]|nr:cation transporter [Clostridia bacterium]
FTQFSFLDPLIALLVALLIIKAAWVLMRKSWGSILDSRISEVEENKIREVILSFEAEFVEIHELRTRHAGSGCLIDLHLVVPRQQRIYRVHELCDRVEEALQDNFTEINVLIHAEPCERLDCPNCNFARLHTDCEVQQGKCEDCHWQGCK